MEFKCIKMDSCSMYNLITTSIRIIRLQPFLNEYCLNGENYKNCARYKIFEKGQKSPTNLLPNGETLKT